MLTSRARIQLALGLSVVTMASLSGCTGPTAPPPPSAVPSSTVPTVATSTVPTVSPGRSSSASATPSIDPTGMVVPGYQLGEIPPVPLIKMPDLSTLFAANDAFTEKFKGIEGQYPGLTLSPAGCDASGSRIDSSGTLIYGDGSGSMSDKNGIIIWSADGSGSYQGPEGTIMVASDGSGSFTGSGVVIMVSSDGSGSFTSREDGTIMVSSDGSGSLTSRDGTIMVSSDGSGSFSSRDETIIVSSDGSGSYTASGLTIMNDGLGHARISGRTTATVPADPLPRVPKLGKFPSLNRLTPENFCGVVMTVDSNVLFDFGKYNIRPDAADILATVAQALKDNNVPRATIEGHTDSVGPDDFNQTLSENRAKAVADALRAAGVTTALDTVGYGETRPVAPNTNPDGTDNPAGRQLNRRVEIFIPAF